jgi:uncharacterized membrane protein
MEIFLLLILIFIVLWQSSKLSDRNRQTNSRLDSLLNEIQELRVRLDSPARTSDTPPAESIPRETAPPVIIPPVVLPLEPVRPPEPVAESVPEPVMPEPEPEYAPLAAAVEAPAEREPQPSWLDTFLRNNPDLEKFIGENLINKIGIAILVLGIGYFVKFAIDKDWINEIGRVGIGILAGGALIGIAHRLRNTFAAFSSVLVGGGLAVLYFTVAIAFHEYGLFSQTVAFSIMVLITGFSILLSVLYNRVELAVVSILGGIATPFMVSTGEGNYQVLFTYILILNAGMLILAYLRKWIIINWIAYGGTVLLYGGWLSTRVVGVADAPYTGALVFGTLFYLVFFLMNIINNIKEKTRFTASEISILLSNTFLYYSAGMTILANIREGTYQGLFTVAVALFNFGFAFALYKNERVDRNLIYLLIGLVVTFISLAVPVQLEGNYITMFWALEAVLLLWLAQKSGIRLVSVGAVIVTGLMLISLAMDWQNIYGPDAALNPIPVLLNKAFITSILAIISLVATIRLLASQTEAFDFWIFQLEVRHYRQALGIVLVVVAYLAGLLELNHQLVSAIGYGPNRTIILGAYNLLSIAGLMALAQRQGRFLGETIILGVIGIIAYLVTYNASVMYLLSDRFLYGEPGFAGFPFHYLSLLLVLVIVYYIYRSRALLERFVPALSRQLLWPICALLVYMASAELLFHVLFFNFAYGGPVASGAEGAYEAALIRWDAVLTQTNKIGFPILWGVFAFTCMFIGLSRKNRTLRIISLSLFGLTLAKLFLYDIRNISEGGKIVAFIFLGVLLLVISFMYQRIKRLILPDSPGGAGVE